MKFLLFLVLTILFQNLGAQVTSRVVKVDSHNYLLEVVDHLSPGDSVLYTKRLPYPVYRFIQADIDNDGIDEFLVGSERITILDSIVRKRINIWKIGKRTIVPMWLGSKMPHPVNDFNVFRSAEKTFLRTMEIESNGLFLVADYEWHSFGLKFKSYIKRQLDFNEASAILRNL
jgi:hypothetical protein